ncbi:MAG TPA: ATP-binding protein [Anaeromyxobacteraceae bacterium]|nr:ATP-binding protein [Anaeromyxobacteraceae bacterium]
MDDPRAAAPGPEAQEHEREPFAQLRESERRFRELFEFVPVSLWEVDLSVVRAALDRLRGAEGGDVRAALDRHPEVMPELVRGFRVLCINAVGYTQVGASSREELMGRLGGLFDPETFPRYRELGLQLAEGRKTAYAEGWSATVTGQRCWLGTTATAVPGHEDDWRRVLFASVDLTERRRAEEARLALEERLRQAEKLEAIGRLAGGIAHDFNNLLAGILGYAELTILGATPGSETHEHQERIREATLRGRSLVRQILAFSRRDRAEPRPVDVPAVVKEALALMRAGIPSSITLEERIDPEAGATFADPTQIHQVVLNLCANARDAVGAYGRIEVGVSFVDVGEAQQDLRAGRYVLIRVKDDGAGMDDATRARIFEPFMTTKGDHGGHGLGLAVVHGIVSAAGGAVRVESAPGRGAAFDVYLPRREAPPTPAPEPAKVVDGGGKRILLVDDDPLVRGSLRGLLQSAGYAVEVAEDGQQAFEAFREAPSAFDAVLTDQSMPRMEGVDLARAVLALRPGLPVILCTGYGARLGEAVVRGAGLKAVLSKPIERVSLIAAVRAALEPGQTP